MMREADTELSHTRSLSLCTSASSHQHTHTCPLASVPIRRCDVCAGVPWGLSRHAGAAAVGHGPGARVRLLLGPLPRKTLQRAEHHQARGCNGARLHRHRPLCAHHENSGAQYEICVSCHHTRGYVAQQQRRRECKPQSQRECECKREPSPVAEEQRAPQACRWLRQQGQSLNVSGRARGKGSL